MELLFTWGVSHCSEQLPDFEQNFIDNLMAHEWQAHPCMGDQKPHPYTRRRPPSRLKGLPPKLFPLLLFCMYRECFFLSSSLFTQSKFEAARETAFSKCYLRSFPGKHVGFTHSSPLLSWCITSFLRVLHFQYLYHCRQPGYCLWLNLLPGY